MSKYIAFMNFTYFAGLGIVEINYDNDGRIIVEYVCNEEVKSKHNLKLYYNSKGAFFIINGIRYYLNDFIKMEV